MEYIIQNIDSRGDGVLKIKWVFAIAESTEAQCNQPVQLIITAVLFVALYLTVCQQFCEKNLFSRDFYFGHKRLLQHEIKNTYRDVKEQNFPPPLHPSCFWKVWCLVTKDSKNFAFYVSRSRTGMKGSSGD